MIIDVANPEEIAAMIRANHRLQTAEDRGHAAIELLKRVIKIDPAEADGRCYYCQGESSDHGQSLDHLPDCLYLEITAVIDNLWRP